MNLSSLDLNLLVALHALLQESNVTRAAKRIHLSQPAMSHALARLRDLFEDPLLVRAGRSMTLTARAAALKDPLAALLAEVEALIVSGSDFDAATSHETFKVAADEYALFSLLPAMASELATEAPGVSLRFMAIRPIDELAKALEAGQLDLAITLGIPEDLPRHLYHRNLFQLELVCVVRQDHPRVRDTLDLDTYCSLSHILISPRGSAQGVVDWTLENQGRERHVAMVVGHFLLAPHLVAKSDYVLTTARAVVEAFEELLPLKVFAPPLELERGTISLVWHERTHASGAHQWLRDFIAGYAPVGS